MHKTYIGQFRDDDTDLQYLNARYYEGSRGQFLSQDPVFWEIGLTQDGKKALMNPQLQNSYSYAGNNPIINKDPQGRQLVETGVGIAYILSWAGFINYGLDRQIQQYEIETMKNYPNVYSQQEVNAAQQKLKQSEINQAISTVFGAINQTAGTVMDIGSLIGDFFTKVLGVNSSKQTNSTTVSNGSSATTQNQSTMNKSYNFSSISNVSSRVNAVNTYNSSSGASTPQSKLWVAPSGAVITWGGQVVVSPISTSNK